MSIVLSFFLAAFGLIPAPAVLVESEGCFKPASDGVSYSISASKGTDPESLSEILATYRDPAFVPAAKADIRFFIGERYAQGRLPYGATVDEGYALEVKVGGITVKAGSTAGAFYAVQTLRQLFALNGNIPCCHIEDAPYFGYRGLLFDVCRHFFSVEYLKKQFDAMAFLKLNRFHLHLTDDQSFRLLLDSHPEMARNAGFRKSVALGLGTDFVAEPANYVPGTVYCAPGVYGGYYSKDNIRDLIEYAALRGIEIIPEIEMPGHNTATNFVHPEFLCSVDSLRNKNDLCLGKEETFKYLEEVMAEVMELFPSKMIHIGGDEAKKTNWKVCPDCERRMKEEGLASVDELQSYGIKRIERFVRSHGKRIIGWDEILQGGVSQTACLMLWRGNSTRSVEEARKSGNDMIDCVSTHNYLNNGQAALYREPFAQTSLISLERVYSERPEAIEHMLGVQACMWSEWITSPKHHEYLLYPRTFALAEKGWTPLERRNDFGEFRARALDLLKVFRSAGYTTFDLENEHQPTAANYEKIEHLAVGARVTLENGKEAPAILTDSRPGNFFEGWWASSKPQTMTVDLKKNYDIHYIGISFKEMRSFVLPLSVEVSVSEDGRNFRSLGIKDIQLNGRGFTMSELGNVDFDPYSTPDSRKSWQGNISWTVYPVNYICNLKNVRFIRYSITPDTLGCSFAVDELIVN